LLNQARLKVLQAQQQHIQNLLAEARTRLGKSSSDRANYTRVVCDLIIQALFQVLLFYSIVEKICCQYIINFV
jgi:V-type H+-transporting ATPase subunit E